MTPADTEVSPSPAWAEGPYSIKRHGVTVTNCDSEPVQTPGCIQAHGALLVLRPTDLCILQASENSARLLGSPPSVLLGRPISVVIGDEGEARLRQILERELIERSPLCALSLPARVGGAAPLDISLHTIGGVVILEFEESSPTAPGSRDDYAAVKRIMSSLATVRTLGDFHDVVVESMRAFTGFDRVMIYKFHADGHGEVIAESKREDLPPWLGLHYPTDDIPKQVREIFTKIWIRPVPDVDGDIAELVPLVNPDTGAPLDMTYCALRAASIMYIEYLKNMRVEAGLTMAIRRGEALWGLIACHHYSGPRFTSIPMRTACELLAQSVSLQHAQAESREDFTYRMRLEDVHQELISAATQERGLASLTVGAPNLLDGICAGGAALFHTDRWWCVGNAPDASELDALREWLVNRPELREARAIYATDHLAADYPRGEALSAVASGVIAVPLSRTRRNLMIWFRPEIIQTVRWAGNPHDKPMVPGPQGPRLTPRRSFELFTESVRGRSLPWRSAELDAAVRLRILIMELVVTRAERLANLNADLLRSNDELEAFAHIVSHDLKEPLRGIHKYAHQLLDDVGGRDEESCRKLEALMRLAIRMDGLLDSLLHCSRVGRTALTLEPVDLNEVMDEAIEMVDARRTDGSVDIVIPRPLPVHRSDRVRVREVLVNLLSNALKYNDKPRKVVEVGFLGPGEPEGGSQEPCADPSRLIFYVKDNGIGIHPKHFDQVFKMFRRLHGRDEYGGGTGVGLTIAKKLIERHGGHIWLTSKVGAGTTFYFTLPCEERP